MRANQTAVVLIEFQNEFCKEGGKLYGIVKDELARVGTIDHAVGLAEKARAKGCLVIHDVVAATSRSNQEYVQREIYPLLGGSTTVERFIEGLE